MPHHHARFALKLRRSFGVGVLPLALLAACGGADEQVSGPNADASKAQARVDQKTEIQTPIALGVEPSGPASAADQAALAQGARLNQDALAAAEQHALAADQAQTPEQDPDQTLAEVAAGAVAPRSAYTTGAVAAKAAAVRIPAYRFFNTSTGAHFYTTSEAERTTVASTLSPPFSFEGPAFSVASAFSPGLSPVHRFYNTRSGVHFYTISEAERANVVTNLPQFRYEGVAYHASQVAGLGLTPLYRFFVSSRGFHFYTASASERDNIIANNRAYTYEGVSYHVLAAEWRAEKLPHTGVTTNQCYQSGSNSLTTCSSSLVTDFNAQQDGHRTTINPMSYSAVGGRPLTSCVRDNVTGLIWEGKEASGTRAGSNTYSNVRSNTATDASGYVNAVNLSNLCGFSDWRLPTKMELLTLVDYGKSSGSTAINALWFPNTASTVYWSGDGFFSGASAWVVSFSVSEVGGSSNLRERVLSGAVRLVRGTPLSSPRFSYSTVPYPGDAANNAVNDAWTGLQWRRCEQGRVWSGNSCSGNTTPFNHAQALAHARQQTGWRLPNVKELASLVYLSEFSASTTIDPVAFPGVAGQIFWTSSPYVGDATRAWSISFAIPGVNPSDRSFERVVRLVRFSP